MGRAASGVEAVQPGMLAFVLALFILSPNLLYAVGVPYTVSAGSQLAKIHPAFYGAIVLLAVFRLRGVPRGHALGRADAAALVLAGVAMMAILLVAATTSERGGGELSALVVTYLLPALVVLVLGYANPRTLAAIPALLGVMFLVNSTVAIVESRSGVRLLPFVAGDAILSFDRRPTALLGHPLTNATLTGGWVLLSGMRLFRSRLRAVPLGVCAFHLLALVCFGGRMALVATVGLLALFVLVITMTRLARGGGGREVLRALGLALLACLLVPLVIRSGLADLVLARFADGRGSDETRVAALQILASLDTTQWWAGVPGSLREALQMRVRSGYGIELSWVALIVIYGLPIAGALLGATLLLLAATSAGRGLPAGLLSLYFVAVTFASLSIASKSLLISQVLVLLLCIPRRQHEDDLADLYHERNIYSGLTSVTVRNAV